MLPSLPVQKAQNRLAKISLIVGLISLLAAILFHFFSYFFTGSVDKTILNLFISAPIVIGMISITIAIISLSRIMTNNIFGRRKATIGIVFGSVVLVGLFIFLFLLLS